MTQQLAIDLPFRQSLGPADFLVSGCNRAAFEAIEHNWPGRALAVYGPAQCGKTHLARLWIARTGARLVHGPALHTLDLPDAAAPPGIAVDEADGAPEQTLLHLYNYCREIGSSLLIVTRLPPSRWPIALPDLASRLRAMPVVGINPPDDTLLAGLLIKHFADRQIRVAPSVIDFAVKRIERSFAAAAALVDALDRAALGAGGPIRIALVRRMLAENDAQH